MEQVKKHNGYIVPFDIPSESLKKGDILRHKNGLDDDMFENIVILNSSYCLPPEWVETWEKYYQEQVKQTAVEWLLEQFEVSHSYINEIFKETIDQAKAMEKKQMADKWQEGYDACEFHNDYENLQTKPINNPYK